jgi:hypothetical protein
MSHATHYTSIYIKESTLFVLFVMLKSPKPQCPYYVLGTLWKRSMNRGAQGGLAIFKLMGQELLNIK